MSYNLRSGNFENQNQYKLKYLENNLYKNRIYTYEQFEKVFSYLNDKKLTLASVLESLSNITMNKNNQFDLNQKNAKYEAIDCSASKFSEVFKLFIGDKCLMVYKYPNHRAKYEFEFKDEFLHEIFVGVILNKLRPYVPNFVYTYGYEETNEDHCNPYIIFLENIPNSDLLENYIPKLSKIEFFVIFLQILNALNLAYEEYSFCHYDLHDGNILIQKIEFPFSYKLYIDGKVKKIKTNYLAKIIDFGQSYVKFNNKSFGVYNRDELKVYNYKSRPINDIYKLLCFSGYTAKESNNLEVYNLISRIYQLFDQKGKLDDRINFFKNNVTEMEIDGEIILDVNDGFNYGEYDFNSKHKKNYLVKDYKHSELLQIIANEFPEYSIL